MTGTWWVGKSDLDNDQLTVIGFPLDQNALVTGPPGSGKTNLLLLRANYLYLAGLRDLAVISFTRSLCDFIASGAHQYDFPGEKVMTAREWFVSLLNDYDSPVPRRDDFREERKALIEAASDLVARESLAGIYDALLIDEAQDYTKEEIDLFCTLGRQIFLAADERQRIYRGENTLAYIAGRVSLSHSLIHHYRNGVKICRVADGIARSWPAHVSLESSSNYDESANPSTVDHQATASLDEQVAIVLERLERQRVAFPRELIGILCPTRDSAKAVWAELGAADARENAALLGPSDGQRLDARTRLVVSTFHAAKGLEFRAAHLLACEEVGKFRQQQRRLMFMAVTRAKTALSLYYSGRLPSFVVGALDRLSPIATLPSLDDVFGGQR